LSPLVPSAKPHRDGTHPVAESDAALALPNVAHQLLQSGRNDPTVAGHFHQQAMVVVEQTPQRNAQRHSHGAVADHSFFRVAKDVAAYVFAREDGPVRSGDDDDTIVLRVLLLMLLIKQWDIRGA
jgi:hypothetical protein